MCDGLAGEEGFEPPWTVLETGILPLYSPLVYAEKRARGGIKFYVYTKMYTKLFINCVLYTESYLY